MNLNRQFPVIVSLDDAKSQLTRILRELGISVLKGRDLDDVAGFPLGIPLPDGSTITLEVPFPGPLAGMDKSQVGVAVIDALGIVRRAWGLARSVGDLAVDNNVLQTPLAGLLDAAGVVPPLFILMDSGSLQPRYNQSRSRRPGDAPPSNMFRTFSCSSPTRPRNKLRSGRPLKALDLQMR